jgi:hypothetical protein
MASQEAEQGETDAPSGPMPPERFLGVDAAARDEAAEPAQERREDHSIGLNEKDESVRGDARARRG